MAALKAGNCPFQMPKGSFQWCHCGSDEESRVSTHEPSCTCTTSVEAGVLLTRYSLMPMHCTPAVQVTLRPLYQVLSEPARPLELSPSWAMTKNCFWGTSPSKLLRLTTSTVASPSQPSSQEPFWLTGMPTMRDSAPVAGST